MPKITLSGNLFTVDKVKELGEPTYTITQAQEENVGDKEKGEIEMAWVLRFAETHTGLKITSERLENLVSIFGSNDSDDWAGQKVTLYVDPDVKMAGKKTGGVRIKAYQEPSKLFTSKANLDRN
jgi:hypothetical protein